MRWYVRAKRSTLPSARCLLSKVTLENGDVTLLDNAIGANFAVIGWGCNPLWGMSDEQIQQWRALGTRFIQVVPEVQIHTAQDNHDGVLRVGDIARSSA
ncbi:hypothetical protein ACLK14_02100 [Escherichia coli]